MEYSKANPFSNELALVEKEGIDSPFLIVKDKSAGNFYFINKSNEIVLNLDYGMVFPFINGLAAVYNDGKVGFINTLGEVAIGFEYDSVPLANSFSDGTAYVQKDNEWFYIDREGNRVEK